MHAENLNDRSHPWLKVEEMFGLIESEISLNWTFILLLNIMPVIIAVDMAWPITVAVFLTKFKKADVFI